MCCSIYCCLGSIEKRRSSHETRDSSQLLRQTRGSVSHRGGHKNGHQTEQNAGIPEVGFDDEPANDARL